MPTQCERCGQDEYMPFACKFCHGKYCVAHRLPENHDCRELETYRARLRKEGRMYVAPDTQGEAGGGVVVPVRGTGAFTGRAAAEARHLWARIDGRVTYVLLGIMAAMLVLEFLVVGFLGPDAWGAVFVLGPDFLFRPWALLTSVFSHSLGFNHFFFNGIVLFFFGPTLESIIGSRRFLGLFVGAGVLAGVAEVFVGTLRGDTTNVLGASGAIMGLLGTLTILAPRLTVLVFFVIPAPLWLVTAGYALLDITYLGIEVPGDRVAHLAHLSGLAVGLAFGKHLRDRGLRVQTMRSAPGTQFRRYF